MRVKINVEDMAAVQERAARVARGDADGPGARETQVTGAGVEGAVGPGEGLGAGVEPAALGPAAAGVASDAPAPPPPPVLGGDGAPSASGAGGSARTRVLVDDGAAAEGPASPDHPPAPTEEEWQAYDRYARHDYRIEHIFEPCWVQRGSGRASTFEHLDGACRLAPEEVLCDLAYEQWYLEWIFGNRDVEPDLPTSAQWAADADRKPGYGGGEWTSAPTRQDVAASASERARA